MAVEAIQCPKCGGPVRVEEGRDLMYCSHCGVGLRITTGLSGHATATLADVKDDISILAKEAQYQRLKQVVAELEKEDEEWQRQYESWYNLIRYSHPAPTPGCMASHKNAAYQRVLKVHLADIDTRALRACEPGLSEAREALARARLEFEEVEEELRRMTGRQQ